MSGAQPYYLKDDGVIPNSALPLLLYPQVIDAAHADRASTFEQCFAQNGWTHTWCNGIYSFPPLSQHRTRSARHLLRLSAGALGRRSGRRARREGRRCAVATSRGRPSKLGRQHRPAGHRRLPAGPGLGSVSSSTGPERARPNRSGSPAVARSDRRRLRRTQRTLAPCLTCSDRRTPRRLHY